MILLGFHWKLWVVWVGRDSYYRRDSYLHCRVRICSFNFKNGYPFAATKVQILFKEVFARGPTRALSGSYVVNWSLELILDTANAQKKS